MHLIKIFWFLGVIFWGDTTFASDEQKKPCLPPRLSLDLKRLNKEHSVFAKVALNSTEGLCTIISPRGSWRTARDQYGRTVISAVIEDISTQRDNRNILEKKIHMLQLFLDKKAIVKKSDVESFLYNMFYDQRSNRDKSVRGGYSREFFLGIDSPKVYIPASLKYRKSLKLAKKLILASIVEGNLGASEDNINNLSLVMDLWCRRDAIASALLSLLENGSISSEIFNIFVNNMKNLFLQDEMVSYNVVNKIYSKLAERISDEEMLLFFVNALELKINTGFKESTTFITDIDLTLSKTEEGMNVDLVASALSAITYDIMGNFSAVYIFRSTGQGDTPIDEYVQLLYRISDFIADTIVYPTETKSKRINYNYWLLVYKSLVSKGDLNMAYFVSHALNSLLPYFEQKNTHVEKVAYEFESPGYQQMLNSKGTDQEMIKPIIFLQQQLSEIKKKKLFLEAEYIKLNNTLIEEVIKLRAQMNNVYLLSRKKIQEEPRVRLLVSMFYRLSSVLDEEAFFSKYSILMPISPKSKSQRLSIKML